MVEQVRGLQKGTEDLQVALRAVRTKQVYQRHIIDASKALVDQYFRVVRDPLVAGNLDSTAISDLDVCFHALLDATHRHTSLTVYKTVVLKIRKLLLEMEKLSLLAFGDSSRAFQLDPTDKRIIDTLRQIVPSSALSYEQGIIDMESPQRLSWRGPATDFREALRESLDYLAPDKEVESSPEFKLEPNTQGPTMKQKAQYVLRKRGMSKNAVKTTQDSVTLIDELLGSFVRSVYTRASASTHTPTDRKEVSRIRDLVRLVLCELLSIS